MNREQHFMQFFTELTAENLSQIDDIFAPNAHFKDPFNDVYGIDAIKTVFIHMFATTERPKFRINHFASNQQKLFIQWQFTFGKNKTLWISPITLPLGIARQTFLHEAVHAIQSCPTGTLTPLGLKVNLN